MAVASYALVTLAEVKSYLNLGETFTAKDTFLEQQIDLISGYIESRCNRKFVVQNITSEIRNGNGRSKLRPLCYPIVQLSVEDTPTDEQKLASVQYRDTVDSAWADIETEVNKIVLNNPFPWRTTEQTSFNIELLEEVFPEGNQNIKLVYKAGESDASKYAEIKMMAIEMVVWRYKQSNQGMALLGVSSQADSTNPTNRNTTFLVMSKEWQDILKRYTVKL